MHRIEIGVRTRDGIGWSREATVGDAALAAIMRAAGVTMAQIGSFSFEALPTTEPAPETATDESEKTIPLETVLRLVEAQSTQICTDSRAWLDGTFTSRLNDEKQRGAFTGALDAIARIRGQLHRYALTGSAEVPEDEA